MPPAGDPEKAKALLAEAGVPDQKIVYAYGNLPRGEQVAVVVAAGLERAGFKVVKKPVEAKTFSEEISDPTNTYDLYGGGWGADGRDGSKGSGGKASPARRKEIGEPPGPEPTRYGDWERNGRCVDF